MPEWITDLRTIVVVVSAIGGLLCWAGYWVGQVNSDRKSFKTFISEVREDMAEIRKKFEDILFRLTPASVTLSSPLRLTDLGEEIATDLKAYEWAAELAPSLQENVKDMFPWEVDDFCNDYVQSSLSDRMSKKVGPSAYQHGLDRSGVRAVLRVVLRDELLKPE